MAPAICLRSASIPAGLRTSSGLAVRRASGSLRPLAVARPALRSFAAAPASRPAAPAAPQCPARPSLTPSKPAQRNVAAFGGKTPVGAASTAAAGSWMPQSNLLKTATYIGMWYAFNIVFNILNKSALNIFTCPYLMAAMQLVVSGLWMGGMWMTGMQQTPRVDGKLIKQLTPVAFAHTVGHVTACVSFSMMAVSFAHIVKAAEPVFSVALSGPFLGTYFPAYVWASLLPIVVGCSLCAMKELSFAWGGFLFAMASNLGMVFRNILSKKCLTDVKDRNLDGINLFGLLSIISCFYCIPLAFVMERHLWGPMWETAVTSMGQGELLKLLALSGVFYHLYNQLSYMVLGQGLSPTSFSVSNTMKRVAVVVSSVIFFQNPVSAMNWVGSAIAIFGTLLYSLACQKQKQDEANLKAKTA